MDAGGLIVGGLGLAAGAVSWWWAQRRCGDRQGAAEALRAERAELEKLRAETLLRAREEADARRAEVDAEIRDLTADLRRREQRLDAKEADQQAAAATLRAGEANLQRSADELAAREHEAAAREQAARAELERLAGLTLDEARAELLRAAEESAQLEAAATARGIEERARFEAHRRARHIVSQAIERCAVDRVAEATVAVVNLDGDEQKGRIIGREGRNIRSFEQLTGVDLIVDDTPETVVISAFDPVRREIARQALEALIADGRIHPARIEEAVDRSRRQVETSIQEAGEQAQYAAGVSGLAPALVEHLGRLQYRTSFGQNVLEHSLEVAQLAAIMAAELGAGVAVCRRAGLLHDLGKAVDGDTDGPHAAVGAELARRHGESEAVVHAVAAHHHEIEPTTPEAHLVAAADALSAARPGARRDGFDRYLERLERLEQMAGDEAGVERVFAMQSGREIRVLVRPEQVDDAAAAGLARRLAERIEAELAYPGQIKVTVIREHRAVEYAR